MTKKCEFCRINIDISKDPYVNFYPKGMIVSKMESYHKKCFIQKLKMEACQNGA